MDQIPPYFELFDLYKIKATPLRVSVLAIFINNPKSEFSYTDILKKIERTSLPVSDGTITGAIRLFKTRKLINELDDSATMHQRGSKRGRRPLKFIFFK